MTDSTQIPSKDLRTLLIVDDDTPFRTRLVRAFRERGFDVSDAANYDEAMSAARADSPEFALVDLRLPGRSGLDLVRSLKDLDATTRIVVLTGYGSIATAVQSLKLGATSYLTKPVDADQIMASFEMAAADARGTESPTPTTPDWKDGPASHGPDLPVERQSHVAQPLARVEWEHIQRVLADCHNNVSQAARILGIHRRSLQRKLSKNPVRESSS